MRRPAPAEPLQGGGACERCGAPYSPGFTFGRWCAGTCDRGSAARGLLVLSCSELKLPAPGPVAAWRRYDGVLFRVCKRLQGTGDFPDVAVRILSAEHGILRPEDPIEPYDRRMDEARALQLRCAVTAAVHLALCEEEAGEVYLAMGRAYRGALDDRRLPAHVRVVEGGGEIGRMQSALLAWLAARSPLSDQLPLWPAA
ncbi:MAG TPA: hypothetical protein VFQ76_08680 [Longimicrobiaceae bacterium]|nr:hypothetical protein [Longimicrobiaceae bacterium]